MGIIGERLGSGELSEEQLARAGEAERLLACMQGYESFNLLEDLETEVPDNLAVQYLLHCIAAFELPRADEPEWEGRLHQAFARSGRKLLAATDDTPDDPFLCVRRAEMLRKKWLLAHQSKQTPRPAGRPAMPDSDTVLAAMLDAFAKAAAIVTEPGPLKTELSRNVRLALMSVSGAEPTPEVRDAIRALEGLMASLAENSDASARERFERLYEEAKALDSAAGTLRDEPAGREYRQKALGNYRLIARLEDVPFLRTETFFGPSWYNDHADALVDAMSLFEWAAGEESAPDKRQTVIDESLRDIVRKFVAIKPDAPDFHEGGYGLAYHYMALAGLTPFREKKEEYVKMARQRLVFNTSFGEDHPATDYWRDFLEDFDERIAPMLLESDDQDAEQ